jgi:1-acyl-sn-glycerol-3-phosphate acyltransferase
MPSLTASAANASSSKSSGSSPDPSEEPRPFFHGPLRLFAQWLFSVYHDIRVEGVEHVPREGPAIIAANHPTYLDAAFLMVELSRPVRFMAWERPLSVPVLGGLLRAYGVIPVDMAKPGRASFEAAVKVLRAGQVFGIFPEGGRTKKKWGMNPFKSGVARLALMTGAPIVPATIIGGRRVWRRGQLLPKPGPIRVVFHPPIRVPASERANWRRDKSLERGVIERVMSTIDRCYAPSLRKEERIRELLRGAPQKPSWAVEGIPLLFLAAGLALGAAGRGVVSVLSGYALLLVFETVVEARGRFAIWTRHLLPWLAFAAVCGLSLSVSAGTLAGGLFAGALAIVWLTVFRFPLYRRLRSLLLATAYGTLLLHLAEASG